MPKTPAKIIIKNVYLYLVTFIGLLMVVIPGVSLLRMGLESLLLPVDMIERYEESIPRPYMLNDRVVDGEDQVVLLEADRELFEEWKEDYANWQERQEERNKPSIQRRRDMANNIAILVGGLILFISHGLMLRKDRKQA